ncbi:trinucleotide repeat-containing gene 6C protein-like [Mantella aurantiaca]
MQPYFMTQDVNGFSRAGDYACQEIVNSNIRDIEPESQKEEHLMEEKKKKKQEEKKKKESAQKKAAEQKNKVPDPVKISSNQPHTAAPSTSSSTAPSSSNGKRASANGQQAAASRYLPREVPPRFRQQEQKQLLKRGQPLPSGTLTTANTGQDTGQTGASTPPPQQGAGGAHHPTKTHSGKSYTLSVGILSVFNVMMIGQESKQ